MAEFDVYDNLDKPKNGFTLPPRRPSNPYSQMSAAALGIPDTSNADYFPSTENRVLTSVPVSGTQIPIFSGTQTRIPFAAIDARNKALENMKMRQLMQEEASKAREQQDWNSLYHNPDQVDVVHNPEYQSMAINGQMQILRDAQAELGRTEALQQFKDPTSKWGQKLANFTSNVNDYPVFSKAMATLNKNIADAKKDPNKFVLPEAEAVNQKWLQGEYGFGSDNTEAKKIALSAAVLNGVQDNINKFLGEVQKNSTENGATTTSGVSLNRAKQLAEGFVNDGDLQVWQQVLKKPDATREDVKDYLGKLGVAKFGTSISQDEAKAATAKSNTPIINGNTLQVGNTKWKKYVAPNGEVLLTPSHTDAGENKPLEFTLNSTEIDPETGRYKPKTVIGSIKNVAMLPDGTSITTVVSHEKDANNKDIIVEHEIPSATEHTNNLDKISNEFVYTPQQVNKMLESGQTSVSRSSTTPKVTAPKEGEERAVQGGTAIFKNGKWVMK